MALPIEDYALIGDHGTAALVGSNGSIDWLCLPRFDSPACFAALLGTEEHGRWLLAPGDPVERTRRRYVDGTACLETTFTTADGEVVLLDVMPTLDGRADVVRRLTCTRGTVRICHEWVVRTDYGKVRPWVSREQAYGDEVVVAVAGPDKLVLRGPRLPEGHDGRHYDEFEISARPGQALSLAWMFGQSNDLFYGNDRPIALFRPAGEPVRGDMTPQLRLWDAGTEVNEEPGLGPNQGPRQKAEDAGTAERNAIAHVRDRWSYPTTGTVLRLAITPKNDAVSAK